MHSSLLYNLSYTLSYSLCNNQSLEEIILFLLSPVLDIISSARTRAYINYSKLLSAVNLLNCILQFHIDGEELLTDIKSKH